MEKVTVQWFEHAFFLISDNTRVAIDPFKDLEGYPNPSVSAEVVLVTHGHFDHSKVEIVQGKPQIVKGNGKKSAKGIEFTGVKTYHDEQKGSQRGENTIFTFELGGIKFAHCGDLGHILSQDQLRELGKVEVLMIPVGGYYTIDAKAANRICQQIKPKVIIPMHYKTAKCSLPIAEVDEFLQGKPVATILDTSETQFKRQSLPGSTRIMVLRPAL